MAAHSNDSWIEPLEHEKLPQTILAVPYPADSVPCYCWSNTLSSPTRWQRCDSPTGSSPRTAIIVSGRLNAANVLPADESYSAGAEKCVSFL